VSYVPPKPQDVTLPERVQLIVDEYRKHNLDYFSKINAEDDLQSLQEIGFEKLKAAKPETAYELIRAIYRIRDTTNDKEFIIYKSEKHVQNNNSQDMKFECYYNMAPILEVDEYKDEAGNVTNVVPRARRMNYTTEWDPKVFDAIIKRSRIKTITNCYIADASEFYDTKFVNLQETGRTGLIYNHQQFRDLSFNDLLIINRTGAATLEAGKKILENPPKNIK
jgi:hypothetical protein